MKAGFGKSDITPRIGVELAGFGPFLLRKSVGVRDPLAARAMAVEQDGRRLLLVSCDLVGMPVKIAAAVRRRVGEAAGIPAEAIMIHATHTHSGPSLSTGTGWGEADPPYVETLPGRIVEACLEALDNLQDATMAYAAVPCEHIGLNREYDRDAPPLEEVLSDDWRPAKPERTNLTCHVLKIEADGRVLGFISSFGCHPVVCCQTTRQIHGDYAGVATNQLEREFGGVGLFLQGASGDINSCVVHKPETEALQALEIIAGRYARSVRAGLAAGRPIDVHSIACVSRDAQLVWRERTREDVARRLAELEAVFQAPGATDTDPEVRMAVAWATGVRRTLEDIDAGKPIERPIEVQGLRIGDVAFLGAPFEVFKAIKDDVVAAARSPIPIVMGLTNDVCGYAPDRQAQSRGGYAADRCAFADIHGQLSAALIDLDAALWAEGDD